MTPEQLQDQFNRYSGQILALSAIISSLPNKGEINAEMVSQKIKNSHVPNAQMFQDNAIWGYAEEHAKKIFG